MAAGDVCAVVKSTAVDKAKGTAGPVLTVVVETIVGSDPTGVIGSEAAGSSVSFAN